MRPTPMLVDGSFRTTSTAEAEGLIGRVYRRPSIRDTAEPFLFRQRMRGDERVNLTRFEISSSAVTAVDLDGVVGIGHLRAGEYRAVSNGDPVDASGPFALRPGQASCRSDGLDLTMVNLDVAALSRFAAARGHASADRLHFERLTLSPGDQARGWYRILAYVTDVFVDPDLFRNDLIRRTAVDLLFAGAITAFMAEPATPAEHARVHPASVRRALQYIDDHAASHMDVAEIAAAARLSVRGLQAAFRRELDTTPLNRVRTVRLAHAHEDLVSGSAETDTVAEIARRWGFAHPSRFSDHYRRVYHQLPSRTLEG